MRSSLADLLSGDPAIAQNPLAQRLVPILTAPTGKTSSGWPYLDEAAFDSFKATIPHILGFGPQVSEALRLVRDRVEQTSLGAVPRGDLESFGLAARVVQQILRTAAITAPPTLWLLEHVLSVLARVGISESLLAGATIDVDKVAGVQPDELAMDLTLLHIMGITTRDHRRFALAARSEARRILSAYDPNAPAPSADLAVAWATAFSGSPVPSPLAHLGAPRRKTLGPAGWQPTLEEIALGWRVVPLVLGLLAADKVGALVEDPSPAVLGPAGSPAFAILSAAGIVAASDDGFCVTALGHRVFERGPGPFGIIAAYHPYMDNLEAILRDGRGNVHLGRGTNIAASQMANRASFQRANDTLDTFVADTGFTYSVFIEHALGRGEATRQRYERLGDAIRYVGADLEDAAIDAAASLVASEDLPRDMLLVRHADIGEPNTLLQAIRDVGLDPMGAVMLVGNGFHEVRQQTDARMVAVFQEYCEAGLVLLFTEETALGIGDQINTAWNTYHAGFRYVHEKSGQGLRPYSEDQLQDVDDLARSWRRCAEDAGYVIVDQYCRRGRTVYPTPRPDGRNPSTSVNYFAVPQKIAQSLGL